MQRAYSDEELKDLCFEMGIDYESVDGLTKQGRIRALVGHFYRRDTLTDFIEFIAADRPNYKWLLEEQSDGTSST